MVTQKNISIVTVIGTLATLGALVTSVFAISDRVVQSENEIDELTKQLSLLETQIEDKKHENVITRIMNAKSLLDSCDPSPDNTNELNHLLSNAIKLASLEKKFEESETQLNEAAEYLGECEFFNQSQEKNRSWTTSTMGMIQAGRVLQTIGNIDTNIKNTGQATMILEVPSDITLFTKDTNGEQVFYTVLGLDFSEGRLIPKCNPPPGNQFSLGETIVSCGITNSKGDELSKSFKITAILE